MDVLDCNVLILYSKVKRFFCLLYNLYIYNIFFSLNSTILVLKLYKNRK